MHKGLVRDFSSFQNLSHPETALSAGFCNKSLVRSFYFFSKSPVTGRCTDTLQRNVTKAWYPHFSFSPTVSLRTPAKATRTVRFPRQKPRSRFCSFPKCWTLRGRSASLTTTCDKSLVIAFFFFSDLSLWRCRTTSPALTRSGNTKKSASEFEDAFVVSSLEVVTVHSIRRLAEAAPLVGNLNRFLCF